MRERGTAIAAQLEAMEQEHERLKVMEQEREREHQRLKAMEQERAASVARLASQLDQIYASTSWQITRPLRGLARPGRSLGIIFRRLLR